MPQPSMTHAERFQALMSFQPVDRLPVVEWATYWDQTVNQWYEQGLPREVKGHNAIAEFFGLDPYYQCWQQSRHWECPSPKTNEGAVIEDEAGYESIHKYLYPDPFFDRNEIARWGKLQQQGKILVWLTLDGFFWYPRTLLGVEGHLMAFYDRPQLMHRMNAELAQHHLRVIDEFCRYCTPAFMTFAEDMSYNHGSMISKSCFDEFMAPYYRQVIPALMERGIVPIVDSDGDVTELVPWFEQVGVRGILPLERQAGNDLVQIRREHPRFCMIGGFDKMVMKKGRQALEAEFQRLQPVMRSGGYIPSVDHQTPPGVTLTQYREYVAMLKDYARRL